MKYASRTCYTRDLNDEDAVLKVRIKASVKQLGLDDVGGARRS